MQDKLKEHIICKYSKDCKQLQIDFIAKKKKKSPVFTTLKFCAEYVTFIELCIKMDTFASIKGK